MYRAELEERVVRAVETGEKARMESQRAGLRRVVTDRCLSLVTFTAILMLACSTACATPSVIAEQAYKWTREITAIGTRVSGSPGIEKTRSWITGKIKKMLAVGQESRVAVGVVAPFFIEGRHIDGFAPELRHSLDRTIGFGSKQNHAFRAPGPTLAVRRIAEGQRLTSGGADFLELAVREETEILRIR